MRQCCLCKLPRYIAGFIDIDSTFCKMPLYMSDNILELFSQGDSTVGHYGTLAGQTGCLPCPKGTFVELDKFPGKHQYACRVCPGGVLSDIHVHETVETFIVTR